MPRVVITGVELVGGQEAFDEMIKNALDDTDVCKPYNVVVKSDYADYVEYGINPIRGASSIEAREFGASLLNKLKQWARKKPSFAGMSKEERKTVVYSSYNKIIKEGIPPAPFIRPAIRDTLSDDVGSFFTYGGLGLKGVAMEIAERMAENLTNNDSIATGALIDSIEVQDVSDGPPDDYDLIDAEQEERQNMYLESEMRRGR